MADEFSEKNTSSDSSNPHLDLRYLVVDDMFTMRAIMKRMLTTMGIKNIADAKDGKVAAELIRLEAAKGTPFHIILSDMNMPEMTGMELLKHCRANEAFKNVGFIMVTAEMDPVQIENAKKFGVDYYFSKPIVEQQFLDALKGVYTKRFQKK